MHVALCAQIKEILVEESNVQPVNSPVTVWGRPSAVKQAWQDRINNPALCLGPQRAWELFLQAKENLSRNCLCTKPGPSCDQGSDLPSRQRLAREILLADSDSPSRALRRCAAISMASSTTC